MGTPAFGLLNAFRKRRLLDGATSEPDVSDEDIQNAMGSSQDNPFAALINRAHPAIDAFAGMVKSGVPKEEPISTGRKIGAALTGLAAGLSDRHNSLGNAFETTNMILEAPYKRRLRDYMQNLGSSKTLAELEDKDQAGDLALVRAWAMDQDRNASNRLAGLRIAGAASGRAQTKAYQDERLKQFGQGLEQTGKHQQVVGNAATRNAATNAARLDWQKTKKPAEKPFTMTDQATAEKLATRNLLLTHPEYKQFFDPTTQHVTPPDQEALDSDPTLGTQWERFLTHRDIEIQKYKGAKGAPGSYEYLDTNDLNDEED